MQEKASDLEGRISHSEHSIGFIQPTHGTAIFSYVINRSVILLDVPATVFML